MPSDNPAQIGIFDSGVGGLSVLRAIRGELPTQSLLYLADQAHVPYGPRSLEEVREFSREITRFLIQQGAQLIVVACNTASAAALHDLRTTFPEIPFVGMEPAVKPAAEHTQTGRVGVLATPATFQGQLYASVVERFAHGVEIYQDTCPGLVEQIEAGALDNPATRTILEAALQPMLARGIDTVVLGCTHYPFVIPLIQDIVGKDVRVIDPAPAIARQVRRVLEQQHSLPENAPPLSLSQAARLWTTGSPVKMHRLLAGFLSEEHVVEPLCWYANGLVFC
jgi:glutamate racemase